MSRASAGPKQGERMELTATALLPYGGVFLAAIVEGEVAYIAAATLVAEGALHPLAVLIAGALGAAIGDQAYFYLFRRRLSHWVRRFPELERAARPLLWHVRRNESLMVLLIRFTPGLRIAIALACAWVDVPAAKFSLLNLASSVLWAIVLLAGVAWVGPTFLERFGLAGWKGALLAGLLATGLIKAFGVYERRKLESWPVAASPTTLVPEKE